jgi:hypothetical protein
MHEQLASRTNRLLRNAVAEFGNLEFSVWFKTHSKVMVIDKVICEVLYEEFE